MGRPPRVEAPGAIHHVTTRGNNRQRIGDDDHDRRLLLAILDLAVSRFEWKVWAYCLMTNHFHLVIETPEPNLHAGMHLLNGLYARKFNRRHGRVGHLFEKRYSAALIESDAYALAACRYVVLNPVRARVVAHPAEWPWSSYSATVGITPVPRFLAVDDLLALLASDPLRARGRYEEFVADGIAEAPFVVALI
jgi:putative transposase